MITVFILKFWREGLLGVCLLFIMALSAGFHSRGQQIEILRAQSEAQQARYEATLQSYATKMTIQEAAVQALRAAGAKHDTEVARRLARSQAAAQASSRMAAIKADEAAAAIRAAKTCEEQVLAFRNGLLGVRDATQ